MPFLDGVPCSIHGLVLPDGTAAFRPVEISILRDEAARTLHLRRPVDVLGPARGRPRGDARRRCTGWASTCARRTATAAPSASTACSPPTASGPPSSTPGCRPGFTQVAQVDRKLFSLLQDALVLGEDPGVRVADVEALLPLIDADALGRAGRARPRTPWSAT